MDFINIGFGNTVNVKRIVAILNPDSSPTRRVISDSRDSNKLFDGTSGRKTRSVIIMDNYSIVLSAMTVSTLLERIKEAEDIA